jgi:CheY-like chemotaxis protein
MSVLLHVEDEDAMAAVFRAAIEKTRIDVTLTRVADGEQALRYLRAAGVYAGAKRPDLVFLDLNMPGMDGWQVLAGMQADQSLCLIPVVVLSTTSRQIDKDRAFALGARHYIAKPAFFDEWTTQPESAYRRFAPSAAASA